MGLVGSIWRIVVVGEGTRRRICRGTLPPARLETAYLSLAESRVEEELPAAADAKEDGGAI